MINIFTSIINIFRNPKKAQLIKESSHKKLQQGDTWTYQKAIAEGDEFVVNGLNIWDFNWQDTGQRIHIKDPLYGQAYTFTVYEIRKENTTALFAAGEFSNSVWGIYIQE